MQDLYATERYERALRLAQRHLWAARVLAAALDRPEEADDLQSAYTATINVSGGPLRRRRTRHHVVC